MRTHPCTAPPDKSEPARHVQIAVDLFLTCMASGETDIPVAALHHIREAGRLAEQYFGGSRRVCERAAADEFLVRLQIRFQGVPNNTQIAATLRGVAEQIELGFANLH
jgi:hypothetical protein